MKRFQKILHFVGDPSDPQPSLVEAVELAERYDAKLTLLDVLPKSTGGPWLTLPGKPDLENLVTTARVQELEEMAAPIEARGVRVKLEVTTGSPFFEIVRRVVQEEYDLVMKTAKGEQDRILGTTALHLMRKCPAPVWVVKPSACERRGRVLVAVDPSDEDSEARELGARVVEYAAALARHRGSELHVVHAWWLSTESMLRGPRIQMPAEEVDALLEEKQASARKSLDDLLENVDLAGVQHKIELIKGLPVDVLSDMASQVDVVVLGTVSRSGLQGVLIGNTAESVLRRIDCSVFAVKPKNFQTPLSF